MKRHLKGVLCAFLFLTLLLSSACGTIRPAATSFEAMDTMMTLTVYGDDAVGKKLQARIDELDRLLDATDANSEINRLNREKSADVSDDTAALLSRSLRLCDRLDGSFDVTVYPAVQAWGFTSGDYRVPDQAELHSLAETIDYRRVAVDGNAVTLGEQTSLDLGAVAKGYAADVCGKLLQDSRAQAAVLNLGGTIRLYGKKPDGSRFSVGVADPAQPAAYFGYLTLDGGTIATSGGYERYFERDGKRYIHILDPKTAAPADNGVLSVTIVADDGTAADALSTALFVMGPDQAAKHYREHHDFECIILTHDHTLYLSEGLADAFTLGDDYDYRIEIIHR